MNGSKAPLGAYDWAQIEEGVLKKRLVHGVGMAFILASPLWITLSEPREYVNFGISLALGILLVAYGRMMPGTR